MLPTKEELEKLFGIEIESFMFRPIDLNDEEPTIRIDIVPKTGIRSIEVNLIIRKDGTN